MTDFDGIGTERFKKQEVLGWTNCLPSFHWKLSIWYNDLRGCNVGTTDERDLLSMPLRWPQVTRYTYQISWWSSAQVILRVLPQQCEML
jgi:hypothetical protein